MSGWHPPIIPVGQGDDLTGHASWLNISPGTVIGGGSEPVALMRAIPGAPEEEHVDVYIRYGIDISSGYNDHLRRCSNSE